MANHGQHSQESSASKRSGGTQTIVELCAVTTSGLTFWSRHRFEIGSELQIRLHREALPSHVENTEEWLNVCGYVIEAEPARRDDGAQGFRVTLLFDTVLMHPSKPEPQDGSMPYQKTRFSGLARMGLN